MFVLVCVSVLFVAFIALFVLAWFVSFALLLRVALNACCFLVVCWFGLLFVWCVFLLVCSSCLFVACIALFVLVCMLL